MLPGTPVTTVPADQTTAGQAQLEKATVTGYLLPRIGDGPQPVTTLDQDLAKPQPGSVIVIAIQAKVGVASAYRQHLTWAKKQRIKCQEDLPIDFLPHW
jgi:hypothetical protein